MVATPNPTAEQRQALAERMHDHFPGYMWNKYLDAADAIRAHNLLSEGAPSEAQVEAAAKAAYEFDADVSELFGRGFTRDFDGMPQWAKDTHLDKARAALVAAQGAAPQAESAHQHEGWMIRETGTGGYYCASCGNPVASPHAPSPPSSGVDEDALVQRIYDELMTDEAVAEVWSNGKVLATARRLVKFAVQGG